MLLSLVYINCDYLQAQTTIPRFEEGERVVFVGNSITHGGHYHSFIWLYYMTRFPDKPITIMNAGIGGTRVWSSIWAALRRCWPAPPCGQTPPVCWCPGGTRSGIRRASR